MSDYHEFFIKMYIIKLARDKASAREYFRSRALARNRSKTDRIA